MSHRSRPISLGAVGRTFRAAASSPFRLQTYLNLLYLLLAFPFGILYFVFLITGFSVGVSLSILVIGAPVLVAVLLVTHAFASFERLTARYLLSVEIDSPGYPFLDGDGLVDRLRSLVLGRDYDYPNVSVGFFAAGDPIHLTPSLRIPWNELLVGLEVAVTITEWEVTTFPESLAVSALGFAFLTLSFAVLNAFAWALGAFSKVFLGGSPREPIDDLRDRLGQ